MTNEEIKKEILHRVAVQKKKRQRVLRVSASVGCAAVVALAGVGLVRGGVFDQTPPVTDTVAKPTTTVTTTTTQTTTGTTVVPTTTAKPTTGKAEQTQTTASTTTKATKPIATQPLLPTYDIRWSDAVEGDAHDEGDRMYYGKNINCHMCLRKPVNEQTGKIAIRAAVPVDFNFVYNGQTIEIYGAYYYCWDDPVIERFTGML